jgi:hypothetical protein
VLAVIDNLAGSGMLVGRSTASEIRTPLEQGYAKAGVGKSAGGSQACEAAAGDGYGRLSERLAHSDILAALVPFGNKSRFLTEPSARFGMTRFFQTDSTQE